MEGQNSAVKFRFHRGSLEESMANVYEVMNHQELINLINEQWPFKYEPILDIEVSHYVYDDRIGWDTYIIIAYYCGERHVIGFTNGEL
jgi:hypothetical protein